MEASEMPPYWRKMRENSNHNIVILILIYLICGSLCACGFIYVFMHVEGEANFRYCLIGMQ